MTIADVDPARFNVQYFDGPAVRTAFVREGVAGVPLLLVHGWPETKRIFWRVIAPLVAAGFDVIVPDLRGFGDSGMPTDGRIDINAHVDDLAALLDHLGVESVVLADVRTRHQPNPTLTMILFGPSDRVIYPAFDRMAAAVFPNHIGPFLLRDCGHFVPWEAPHEFTSATATLCSDLIAAHRS